MKTVETESQAINEMQLEETRNRALFEYLVSEGDYENTEEAYDDFMNDWNVSSRDECLYESGKVSYLVCTDEEATQRAVENIGESLWAFNASFLASYTGFDEAVFTALQPQCESANSAILSLIGKDNLEDFADEAISADGRAHFLNTYDDEEAEQKIGDKYFYIYRID